MKQNKETLKEFFETGDKPTQQQYADLIDSYIDAKQPEGEANRRFVIDENGDVNIVSEQELPIYQAGTNITIDTTDPNNPIINASSGASDSSDWLSVVGTSTESDLHVYIGDYQGNGNTTNLEVNEEENRFVFNEGGLIATNQTSQINILGGDALITKDYADANYHGGATNLSYNAATRTLASSTGADVILPVADTTNAGLMKANFYEEGFFTPSVLGGTYTTGSSTGTSYVREGNIVKVSVKIESVNGTGSSQLAIGNLPFPVSTSGYNHGIVGRFIGSTYATPYDLVANLNAGSNTIRFIPISSTSFISNINFTNGEIRVDMVYRTNVYTS